MSAIALIKSFFVVILILYIDGDCFISILFYDHSNTYDNAYILIPFMVLEKNNCGYHLNIAKYIILNE